MNIIHIFNIVSTIVENRTATTAAVTAKKNKKKNNH